MEKRNIKVSLAKAREWYKSNVKALREVALQAFTKDELERVNYEDITCFYDAVVALGLDTDMVMKHIETLKHMGNSSNQLVAIFKLNIVREALNGEETPKLISGNIYYPYVLFFPKEQVASCIRNTRLISKEEFINEGKHYQLVGGNYTCCPYTGVSNYFNEGDHGSVFANAGFFYCKNREIAVHMSKYFAKLIFEATYSQYNFVEWKN